MLYFTEENIGTWDTKVMIKVVTERCQRCGEEFLVRIN